MEKYLILLAGSPATGKTYLVEKLREQIPDLFVLTPDEGKEMLADAAGFDSLEEKEKLEKRVWKFYYGVLALYMEAGKRVIVSEYPFSDKQKSTLAGLADKYAYEVVTIRLEAEFEILWQRRKKRDLDPNRHLSHLMKSYHFGDRLDDRSKADHQITREQFESIVNSRRYNHFQLGELHTVDVTDYAQVDYQELISYLKNKIEKNE